MNPLANIKTENTNPFTPHTKERQQKKLRITKKFRFAILALVAIGAISFAVVKGITVTKPDVMGETDDKRLTVEDAIATMDINREFEFPVKRDGKEITTMTYTIEKAELRNEILLQGKRVYSLKGRTFLIFTIKLTNDYEEGINIPSKNYIRVSVNDNMEELLAPEIHNDPVLVQAISTKVTRLGLPIYDTDTNIKLHVGAIDNEKEVIPLEF